MAIPRISDPKEYAYISPSGSPFVKIVDGDIFDVKMQYPLMNLKSSVPDCFVREEVFDMLVKAQKYLPEGIKFRIWDTWRPFSLQAELYYFYSESIIRTFNLEGKSESEQKKVISKFVSYPKNNTLVPPVHTTGGAVDLTLIDLEGKELQMGTEFDSFSEKTKTDYFENSTYNNIKENRRILYNAMIKAGFTNLPSEWWHYDYGDRFWAYYNNEPAIYEGIFALKDLYTK